MEATSKVDQSNSLFIAGIRPNTHAASAMIKIGCNDESL